MAGKREHSKHFEKVKKFYPKVCSKQRGYNAVTNPVSNPWITPEEYEEITGEKYVPESESEG